ncbi:hypothetical protein HY502_01160 [Candidatus Woesebacteria bacterium]|nr:hypothetical protein [Candidatus Woesebacteria bacterium]
MPANKNLLVILGVLVAALLGTGTYYLFLRGPKSPGWPLNPTASPASEISEVSIPEPVKSLPGGTQTYNISHGAEVKGPKPTRATIDPLTPAKGEKQTVKVAVTSDAPVTEAKIILTTDSDEKEFPLKLVEGDSSNGTWEASWAVADSYDNIYSIRFYLISTNGTFENGLRFRP